MASSVVLSRARQILRKPPVLAACSLEGLVAPGWHLPCASTSEVRRARNRDSSDSGETLALVKLVVTPAHREEVIALFQSMEGLTAAHPACLECQVLQSAREAETVVFLERWRSEEHLKQHIRSELFRPVLEAMELASEPPEVHVETARAVFGLEYVLEVRKDRRHRDP